MGTLSSPVLSSPATPLDERYRIRRISQSTSAAHQQSPVGIPRDSSIMSASRLIIPATLPPEGSVPPYLYSQGHVVGANMTYPQSNFSPVSENIIPGLTNDNQDSSSPSNSSSLSTSVSSPCDIAHIKVEELEHKFRGHDEHDDEVKPRIFENEKDFVVAIFDDPPRAIKKVTKAEAELEQPTEIFPGSVAKDEGERFAFRSFTEPDNNIWMAIEPKPVEVDNFDYLSAYYGRQASIGNGANVFEHIVDESESEPSEYYYDDDQMTDVDDYDVLVDDYARPMAEKVGPHSLSSYYPAIQMQEKVDESLDTTFREISVGSVSTGKEEKSASKISVEAPVGAHTICTTDLNFSEPQPEYYGEDSIVLFDGSKVPIRCTCGAVNGETPTTAGTSGSFPFSCYPQTDLHADGCLVSVGGGYHCLPMIILQKLTDSDPPFDQSPPSPEFVDSMLGFKSRDCDEGARNISRSASSASRGKSEEPRASRRTAGNHLEGIEFTDPVQLSLQLPPPPEPVFLSPSWQSSPSIPYARAKVPGRPRLTIYPPQSPTESNRYSDETPLWWRYIIFPVVSIFSSRVTRDAPCQFWLRTGTKVETPLAEATTSPERRLEAELRRQKLLWNVMGILLTGVLLGGVVAGVVIYYFGRGGDPGVLAGKHAAAGLA
ncbi:uncharacterized protein V1513DRAFT_435500 [Lipomyces chichibuensis]|uniref:uncharacterized protein n=1 Tax=Lipomyces chichibuensis TaxID=1546026 RepID=UPI003342EC74